MTDDRDGKIRQRAYEIWEKSGRPHGQHEDHWRQAMTEFDPPPGSAAPKTGKAKTMAAAVAPTPVKRKK